MTKRTVYHTVALVSFLGLFSILMLWHTIWYPATHVPKALILVITVTPLLLPLRGFLLAQARSCTWMAYLSILYCIQGLVETYANPAERLPASLEVLFSSLLFSSVLLLLRAQRDKHH